MTQNYTASDYKRVLFEIAGMLDEPRLQQITMDILNRSDAMQKFMEAYFTIHKS